MKITQILAFITLGSLPLYVVRCKDFSWCGSAIPFTLLEVFIILTFFSWIIWRVLGVKKGQINALGLFERLRGPFFWPTASFLILSIIAAFISPDLRSAAGVWKAYFLEPILLFIVVLDLSQAKKTINWAIFPLIISGLWLSALAIWQALTKIDPFAPNSIALDRVTGVYDNPNALGLYLGPLILIGLGTAIEFFKSDETTAKKKTVILFLLISISIFTLAIYLSKSRGAGLAIIASLVFFAVLTIYRWLPQLLKKLGRGVFYVLLLVTAATLMFGFINIDKFMTKPLRTYRDSSYSRLCIWQASRKMLKENFVVGVGISGFPVVYPKYATCEPHSFQYPHNIFLNFWVEIGIVGLILYLWITFLYWDTLMRYKNDFLAIGLLGASVYTFIHGLVDVPYFKNDLSSQFWVLVAIAAWFAVAKTKRQTTNF